MGPAAGKERVYARQYLNSLTKWNDVNGLAAKFGDYLMPYSEQSTADYNTEDWQYLRAEWEDNPFCTPVNDYRLYQTERWIKAGKLDGYYLDNICPRLNRNTRIGTAYLLPDGRVQPGFDLWAMRDYVKRLRTVFQRNRRNR